MKNDRRTSKMEAEVRLRIVLIAPPAGVDFGIQEGKGNNYKTIQKQATIVECWGLKPGRDVKVDLREVARTAEQLVRQAAAQAGQQIDADAARLVAGRAGTDISRLRGDVERCRRPPRTCRGSSAGRRACGRA